MNLGIAGRRALVCASSKGLGLACATALVQEGCEVTLNGRDAKTLEAAAHEAARQFGMVFAQAVLAFENLAALRAHAEEAGKQEFPAEDTPMRPPEALERLVGAAPRGIRV